MGVKSLDVYVPPLPHFPDLAVRVIARVSSKLTFLTLYCRASPTFLGCVHGVVKCCPYFLFIMELDNEQG